jgi:tungstate transport system substrate-binding protein
VIRLATTTSVDDAGLLAVLLPAFGKDTGIDVEVIAVGTGRAVAHGTNGDVDVILIHSRTAETKFVSSGAGTDARDVMWNRFVILGPPDDPANIRSLPGAAVALAAIASAKSPFVSRGDDSGTHKKEKQIWQEAGVTPEGGWYLSVGQGMAASILLAHQSRAYIISDRGTYLKTRSKIELEILLESGGDLHNPYSVIPVNPERHSHAKFTEATALADWLTSSEAQRAIAEFTLEGERLFNPLASPAGRPEK